MTSTRMRLDTVLAKAMRRHGIWTSGSGSRSKQGTRESRVGSESLETELDTMLPKRVTLGESESF